jgi:3-oxoacyl-[acyl-carrier protein] reductase
MDLGLGCRVAAVAGASQGLGKAVARALAQEGCRVALCSRDLKRVRRAAEDIAAETGADVLARAVDVGDAAACRRWADAVVKKWGRLDILVVNSGGPPEGASEEVGEADWEKGLAGSLMSGVRLARLVVPHMRKRKWGRIIFIASTSAKQPIDGLAISNTLRAGVLGLSKTLSRELGPDNILVNVVCPGYTSTERLDHLARYTARKGKVPLEKVYRQWAQSIPLRRLAKPEEIAQAVAFLASDKASYITGVALQVDGGKVTSPF